MGKYCSSRPVSSSRAAISTISLLFFIIITAIISHNQLLVMLVEGRHLRSETGLVGAKSKASRHEAADVIWKQIEELETRKKVVVVDNFRPTEPGHSPGVGHSINN